MGNIMRVVFGEAVQIWFWEHEDAREYFRRKRQQLKNSGNEKKKT